MADTIEQNIRTVEKLLTDLGYLTSGEHTSGQADPALYAALDKAFNDVKALSEKISEDQNIDSLKIQTNGFSGARDTTNLLFPLISLKLSSADTTKTLLQDTKAPQQFIDHSAAVYDFVKHYDTYKQSLFAVDDYRLSPDYLATLNAGSTAGQTATATAAPAPAPIVYNETVTAEETNAAQQVDPQAIAALQSFLQQLGALPPNFVINGQWDAVTKNTYLALSAQIQDPGQDLPKDFAAFQTFLDDASNKAQQEIEDAKQQLQENSTQSTQILRQIQGFEEQRDWDWTDGTWFESHDITNEEIDKNIENLKLQQQQLAEKAQQLQAVIENTPYEVEALQNYKTVLAPLSGILTHTHQSLLDHSAPTIDLHTGTTGGTVTDTTTETTTPNPSALIIETFLNDENLHAQIAQAAKSLGDDQFALARPETVDGVFDDQAQASLQQVLGLVVSPYVLNLEQFQNEAGAVQYSPQLGRAILQGLETTNTGLALQIKEQLGNNFAETEDPNHPGQTVKGAAALVAHLDHLYQQDILKKKVVTKLSLPQMDPMTLGIIGFVIQWLQNSFPNLLPALDGMFRQFTGGNGILDMMPQLRGVDSINQALGGMDNMDPNEQLIESFKRSFSSADDATARTEMETALMRSAAMMKDLPFGDAERRANYPGAVKDALAKALATMGDIKPTDDGFDETLNQAAIIYADTFMEDMHKLNSTHGGPAYQSNPTLRAPDVLLTQLTQSGLNLGQNGPITSTELDHVISAYNNINFGTMDYSHTPLIFKDDNGDTYIAGIDQASNMFLTYPLPVDEISKALADENNSLDAIKDTFPGFALAENNYRHYFNDAVKFAEVSHRNSVIYMASDPSIARPFRQIEQEAYERAEQEQVIARIRQDPMNDAERERLMHSLSGSIVNSRMQAAYRGQQSQYAGGFNKAANGQAAPEVDPQTQQLIALREAMNSDALALKTFAKAPQFYADPKGKIFAFSRVDPKLGSVDYRNAFEKDTTAEMAVFLDLDVDKRMAYLQNPQLMKAHFPKLTAIAEQYPQFSNAFDVGKEIATQFNLHYKPIPLSQRMPEWVQKQIPNAQAQAELTNIVSRQPRIVFSPEDPNAIRIIGKGPDAIKPFNGYDIRSELDKYTNMDKEQRGAIFNNPEQLAKHFPHIHDVAAQYPNIDTASLLKGILNDPTIQDVVIKPVLTQPDPEVDPTLQQTATAP